MKQEPVSFIRCDSGNIFHVSAVGALKLTHAAIHIAQPPFRPGAFAKAPSYLLSAKQIDFVKIRFVEFFAYRNPLPDCIEIDMRFVF